MALVKAHQQSQFDIPARWQGKGSCQKTLNLAAVQPMRGDIHLFLGRKSGGGAQWTFGSLFSRVAVLFRFLSLSWSILVVLDSTSCRCTTSLRAA